MKWVLFRGKLDLCQQYTHWRNNIQFSLYQKEEKKDCMLFKLSSGFQFHARFVQLIGRTKFIITLIHNFLLATICYMPQKRFEKWVTKRREMFIIEIRTAIYTYNMSHTADMEQKKNEQLDTVATQARRINAVSIARWLFDNKTWPEKMCECNPLWRK